MVYGFATRVTHLASGVMTSIVFVGLGLVTDAGSVVLGLFSDFLGFCVPGVLVGLFMLRFQKRTIST